MRWPVRIERGRASVALIVGRDTKELDQRASAARHREPGREFLRRGVRAAVLAPVGGLPGGIAYKMVNTADSMIGHKTEKYIDFRLRPRAYRRRAELAAGAALRCCGWARRAVRAGASPRRVFTIAWRDARRHDSPNAGWPEAAMAGALGVR
jgi:adenosylcobinamide-phosphate synthase